MRYIKFLILAVIVIAGSTVQPEIAEAKKLVAVPPCGQWPETPIQAINNGATVTNINPTSTGTYVSVSQECYTVNPDCGVQGGIGCINYEVRSHVYFIPAM